MDEIKELKEKIKLAKEYLELLEAIEKLEIPKRDYTLYPYPEPYPYPCPRYPWIITYPHTTGDSFIYEGDVVIS